MNKKSINKLLGIVLGVLAITLILLEFYRKNNKNILKTNSIAIDTSNISKITIEKNASYKEKAIIFSKQNNEWKVSNNEINSDIKKGSLKNLFSTLKQIQIERLVSKKKEKWADYQLTDSLATKITITKDKSEIKLFIGKTKYQNPTNNIRTYGVSGSTYVRTDKNPLIYEIKGTLSGIFNRSFNSWRNSDFLKLDKNYLTKLEFKYPNKEKFTLSKNNTTWHLENQIADSTKVAQFLTKLTYKTNSNFADAFKPSKKSDHQLTISRNNGDAIIIESYKDTIKNKYYLLSSLNPKVFFESDTTGVFSEIFVSKDYFLK